MVSVFLIAAAILFMFAKVVEYCGWSAEYTRIGALVLGALSLFYIFSDKTITCPHCGYPIFNQLSILLPIPKACKKCKKTID